LPTDIFTLYLPLYTKETFNTFIYEKNLIVIVRNVLFNYFRAGNQSKKNNE